MIDLKTNMLSITGRDSAEAAAVAIALENLKMEGRGKG